MRTTDMQTEDIEKCLGDCRNEDDKVGSCTAATEDEFTKLVWLCTRNAGHTGGHAACGHIKHNYYIWEAEDESST